MPAFVYVADGALAPDRCTALIEKFHHDAARQPGRVGEGVDPSLKRSTDLYLTDLAHWQSSCDDIRQVFWTHVLAYAQRFPHLVVGGLLPKVVPSPGAEPVAINARTWLSLSEASRRKVAESVFDIGGIALQHYRAGAEGYPHWHSEIYPQRDQATALHRVLFVLMYLNDVSEGGHTEFAYQKLRVEPRAGRIVLAPAGFTHTHRGLVPQSSDKFILASWVVFRPLAAAD